jgi:hypothetical protein
MITRWARSRPHEAVHAPKRRSWAGDHRGGGTAAVPGPGSPDTSETVTSWRGPGGRRGPTAVTIKTGDALRTPTPLQALSARYPLGHDQPSRREGCPPSPSNNSGAERPDIRPAGEDGASASLHQPVTTGVNRCL